MMRASILIVLSLAAGLSPACGGRRHVAEGEARAPIAVTTIPVSYADTTERLEAGGVVGAQESAVVSSRIVATIRAVRVTAGDRVRAGDVLVTLDARDLTDRTRQANASALASERGLVQVRAEHEAAEAELRLAEAWQKRMSSLHARRAATDQERDEAAARLAGTAARVAASRAGIDVAEANVTSARAAAGAAATTQSFTTLSAPFDGLVTERFTDPGNLAAPGMPLLRIESEGARQVVVTVDEARATYVQPRDTVEVLIDRVDGVSGQPVAGIVTEVARAIAADQRAFAVKIALPPGVTARTGTFARVILRGAPRRALLVPASAVRRHGQVTSVFVVKEGTATLRLVRTGTATDAGVEVLAGLDAGEAVVTAPPPQLLDGSQVSGTAAARPPGVSQ